LARLDQYYTHRHVAQVCLSKLNYDDYDVIVEPSAGDGSFFDFLPADKRVGIDLKPAGVFIQTGNFFDWKFDSNKKYLVVGNPPFGKNSSMAKKFFNHAAEFADTIAFILPRTFRKISVINQLDNQFLLEHEEILPKDSFYLPDGQACDIPCIFQIWKRGDYQRNKIFLPTTHDDFSFVKKELADFAIRRVGVRAGKVFLDFGKCSVPSHYFIKQHNKFVANIFENLWHTKWNYKADRAKISSKWDTAGNPSLAKTELIEAYTQQIRGRDEKDL